MFKHTLGAAALSLLFNSNAVQASPVPETSPATGHLFKRVAQISPQYPMFTVPLPIPPVKQPRLTVTNPVNGQEIWYYEVEIKPFTHQVYPDLGSADLVGYDGMSPGPTFQVPRGVETVVRFINNAEAPNSVHLHGSFSRAAFDGWAEDITEPGSFKDYYYPNRQSARTLWYHDHAMHITAENAYRGQAGLYMLTDPAEDALNLPSGYGEFDIPMILTSKQYTANGNLVTTNGELNSFWGDVIHVNGQPWPFKNVEPRKYRFRFLDAAVSRSFGLYFADTDAIDTRLPFKVIASDSGLLEHPADTSLLYISMAERYEVVFDFSDYAGKTIELRNLGGSIGGIGTDTDYDNTDKVMRFVVADDTTQPDTSVVPANLRDVPFPSPTTNTPRQFRFGRTGPTWTINGVAFADVQNRLLANVPVGTVERWELINAGNGWTHPIHIHLVDFKVISRTSGNNARTVMPYESGLKDVVWLGRRETVVVEAHYAPFPGVYMFHCHNLIHEDHDMMAAFNATVLPDYGYNATVFVDPMEELWQARPYELGEFQAQSGQFSVQAVTERIQTMAEYRPYAAADE
uniref:Bilirubin oxidase n=2 Tax=Albifimbria verrucaria TaxID=1859699 RepID=BLRO_ALBVE|nr:RecName: Full=Bilirubin oxidase; Flags: Precursor [Albifimbria verrucaria]BAA02123.1 bilirubin oxidase [Albifimbria verrucaria]BAA03166.1 bilirubin oxidase [Albifimbria verrucaria]